MRKKPDRKLVLHRETLRQLTEVGLEQAAGGGPSNGTNCPTRIPCLTDNSCDRTCTC